MHHQIASREKQLEKFLEIANDPNCSEEIRSHLAKLGVVLICGYIERCVEVIIMERLRPRAQNRVLSFIKSHFKKGTNYSVNKVSELLARFDDEWEREFSNFIETNSHVCDAVRDVYDLRNSIAHGGAGQSITTNSVKKYYESAQKLMKGLIEATRD